jgi:hypothetical protein
VGESGQALAGAVVTLTLDPGGPNEAAQSVTTESDGSYRFEGITGTGPARLGASAKGYVGVETGAKWSVSGAPSLKAIAPGVDYADMDFKLLPEVSHVAGRVLDKSRVPIPGARLVVAKQSGDNSSQGWYGAMSDAQGHFDIHLPGEGECTLNVYKKGYGTGYFPNIAAGSESLELVLEGGGSIAGRAVDRAGVPVKGKQVVILGERAPGDTGNEWESPGKFTLATDDKGEYRQDDLSPGFTYTVRLMLPTSEPPAYSKDTRTFGDFMSRMDRVVESLARLRTEITGNDILGEKTEVAVRAGETTRVDFVTALANMLPALVSGEVTDSTTHRPVCPQMVFAVSEEHNPEMPLLGAAVTQPDGSYSIPIDGLSRSVRVVLRTAYCSGERNKFGKYTDFLSAQPQVAEFNLKPGEERSVNFEVPSSITVPIHVVDANGKPLAGMEIDEMETDADGRLTMYGLAPNTTHVFQVCERVRPVGRIVRGQTGPIVGKPGETLPEVQVVCSLSYGRVVGHLVLPDWISEYPDQFIGCRVYYPEIGSVLQQAPITPDGAFTIPNVCSGRCSILLYVMTFDPQYQYWAFIENVDVRPGDTTDVGAVTPNPPEPQ